MFIIILTLKEDKIHCLWFIPIALFMFFGSLKPSTKLYNMLLDKTYEGDLQWNIVVEGNVISAEGIQRYEIKNLEDVKKVVDMGDFYKIYFYFPHKSNLFICQKDLLVKGTIEEFEKLFSSVMVRKNNKI